VNAVEENGWSALHFAAHQGSEKSCALLMQYGADLALRTCDGVTPLQIAQLFHPEKRELRALLDGSVPPSQCGAKCDRCGKAASACRKGLNVCPCERALYCSTACQLAAWGEHSAECLRLRAAKEKATAPRTASRDKA
jgi:hypothetical protein